MSTLHTKHIIIGTAGHVDHGKTTLVRALTGVDTDRLPEEKAREMTIDLGFAPFVLPDGQPAAIVDVPGHERFVGNMLAGATGVDMVLLVVAADQGVMPQTREHLDILDLLGVESGIVVLTRADLVDPELLEVVGLEVREALAGTFLAEALMLPVSAVTGEGLAQLLTACQTVAGSTAGKPASGPARLPVDRTFTAPGFGTIVTGTLVSGRISVDDQLELLPAGPRVRVRGIEVHGEQRELAEAGERVAVNLAGVSRDEAPRGTVPATPGCFTSVGHFDAEVRLLPHCARPLRHGQRLHLHSGTSEVLVRTAFLEARELAPGSTGFVQFHAESPVAVGPRDRLIIRQYSPVTTLGGGVVLDTFAVRRRRRLTGERARLITDHLTVLRDGSPPEVASSVVAAMERDSAAPAMEAVEGRLAIQLHQDRGVIRRLVAAMDEDGRLVALPAGYVMSRGIWGSLVERVDGWLGQYHARWPMRPGAARDELRAGVGVLAAQSPRAFAAQLDVLERQGRVVQRLQHVALPGFEPQLTPVGRQEAERILGALAVGGTAPPARAELSPDPEVLSFLVSRGEVIRVAEDLYFDPANLRQTIALLLQYLQEHGAITVSDFRQLVETTRKYALPLLAYLDQRGITSRQGDLRIAGPKATST